jgi:hypothetical protein
MNGAKNKKTARPSEQAIDEAAAIEAGDGLAWESPVRVKGLKTTSVSIPNELAARAACLANLHRESGLDGWVERVLRERVELEERAIRRAKKELAS